MKAMHRVALTLGLVFISAGSIEAAEAFGPVEEVANEVYVVNNHLSDVRVYAEDASGRLHRLGRVSRGRLKSFEIPSEVAGSDFRIKVFPSNPLWASPAADFGIKTGVLDFETDHQVTVWLEADLAQSKVEIDRG